MSLGQAWEQVRPALPRLIGLALVVVAVVSVLVLVGLLVAGLLIAAGGAVLLVLAIPLGLATLAAAGFLYVRWSLAPCALVLEKVGLRTSLRRSWLLVKGDSWRVFGILLLAFVVVQFVSLVILVPFQLFGAGGLGGLTGAADPLATRTLVVTSIGNVLAATLVAPFSSGIRALLYVDRRMRAEGLDVALHAAANARP